MTNDSNSNIDLDSVKITDVIDINLLQRFQDNFAESMDIASITVDIDGKPVTRPSSFTRFCKGFIQSTEVGKVRCAECHRLAGKKAAESGSTYIYKCHAGLIGFAAPILVEGKQIGTILGGQVLTKKIGKARYMQIARELEINEKSFGVSVNKIKIISKKNIKAAAEVLYIVANALSKIGYEELKLRKLSTNLQFEVLKKESLLLESKKNNEVKTQLFSTISHELKTPLNIIFGSVQLLESYYNNNSSANENEILFKYSKIMKQNCYRLIRLINNIIDMNKIESGFFNLNLKNNNIVKIVEDITMSVVEHGKLKDINIIFDTEIEEKIISCDSEKLERITLNLLSNAIKFTEPGGEIEVNIYDRDSHIVISVKDTGTGIPKDMQNRIFETFTQVESSLRRNVEGSGIGLSLVKSLIEMHEGEIFVESELGVGSEFIVKLPFNQTEGEEIIHNQEENKLNDYVENIKIEFSDIYI